MRKIIKNILLLAFCLGVISLANPVFQKVKQWYKRWAKTQESSTPYEVDMPHNSVGCSIDERLVLNAQDGCVRKGVLTLRPNARGNIVLCHPATFDKEFMKQFVDEVFTEYNCLRFDFRRHGDDATTHYSTCGKKEVYEAEAAVNHLKNHPATKHLPTYGFGISLGAAVLIQAESQKNLFDGLILQSTFERLSLQIRRTVPLFNFPPFRFFMFREPTRFYLQKRYGVRLHRINPIKAIRKITVPMFLIHAQDDACISFEAFEALKEAGGCNIVRTWTPETGEHTKLYSHRPEEYKLECRAFLDSLTYAHLRPTIMYDTAQPACDHAFDGYRVSLTTTTVNNP